MALYCEMVYRIRVFNNKITKIISNSTVTSRFVKIPIQTQSLIIVCYVNTIKDWHGSNELDGLTLTLWRIWSNFYTSIKKASIVFSITLCFKSISISLSDFNQTYSNKIFRLNLALRIYHRSSQPKSRTILISFFAVLIHSKSQMIQSI